MGETVRTKFLHAIALVGEQRSDGVFISRLVYTTGIFRGCRIDFIVWLCKPSEEDRYILLDALSSTGVEKFCNV